MKRILLWFLKIIGVWSKTDQDSFLAILEIENLEKEGKFEDAMSEFLQAKTKFPIIKLAPVWRIEGEYYLRKEEYRKGLEAFMDAISLIKGNSSLVGICYPERIYCGAAIAAFNVGDIKAAEHFCNQLLTYEKVYKNNGDMLNKVQWLNANLREIRGR
jgi:tetratricopeptide (TPR) repeat protein